MPSCFFATDLHGKTDRYDKLLASIIRSRPAAVFLGGDLLPRSAFSAFQSGQADFVHDYLVPAFTRTRDALGAGYPDVFLILGNDDPRREEESFVAAAADGIWHYIHGRKLLLGNFHIYGLAYVPPTPFMLKDWEHYDVSRYVPPGCVSPEEGYRSVLAEESEIKWATIQKDLASLVSQTGMIGQDLLARMSFRQGLKNPSRFLVRACCFHIGCSSSAVVRSISDA